jgi:hypothetical protein
MIVRERQFNDSVYEAEEEEEGERVRDFAGEACGGVLRDDAATDEAPYFGPDVVVDDGELSDKTEDGGDEVELGFCAAVGLHM